MDAPPSGSMMICIIPIKSVKLMNDLTLFMKMQTAAIPNLGVLPSFLFLLHFLFFCFPLCKPNFIFFLHLGILEKLPCQPKLNSKVYSTKSVQTSSEVGRGRRGCLSEFW